jgi:hypothetical protein
LESEWRKAVWEIGLSQSGIKFAARVLDWQGQWPAYVLGPIAPLFWAVVTVPPGELPITVDTATFGGHLPGNWWGFKVVPD